MNGFWKYLDVVNQEGISIEGFPLSLEDNRFYSSPILFDLDKDGKVDIISVDDNGVIRVINVLLVICHNDYK